MFNDSRIARISRFLKEKYNPSVLIVYGSFAAGNAGDHSDFDAMLLYGGATLHDGSVVDGIPLDVFCYNADTLEFHPENFVQVFDGHILVDTHGVGKRMQQQVMDYIQNTPKKSPQELDTEVGWCEKMLLRTRRQDAEGFFRWHWLLTDSLMIYHDILGEYYFGPKKSILKMQQRDPNAYSLYARALQQFDQPSLEEWIHFLRNML